MESHCPTDHQTNSPSSDGTGSSRTSTHTCGRGTSTAHENWESVAHKRIFRRFTTPITSPAKCRITPTSQGRTKLSDLPVDEKYVVFKREDWARRRRQGLPSLDKEIVTDAVVIRRQDMASPPIFDAYSNFYLAMATITKSLMDPMPDDSPGYKQLRSQLAKCFELADYFHAQSVAAWNADRKFPT